MLRASVPGPIIGLPHEIRAIDLNDTTVLVQPIADNRGCNSRSGNTKTLCCAQMARGIKP